MADELLFGSLQKGGGVKIDIDKKNGQAVVQVRRRAQGDDEESHQGRGRRAGELTGSLPLKFFRAVPLGRPFCFW